MSNNLKAVIPLKLDGKRIGFALTGSFCNFSHAFKCLEEIVAEGATVTPIISNIVDTLDTRFGKAEDVKARLAGMTGNKVLRTIAEVEPIGPQNLLDLLLIIPATGNTVAKLANGITDTPALMSAKSHLRNGGPVVIALSSNDALGNGAKNIGALLNARNIYFAPFGQDDPLKKPRSLTVKWGKIVPAIEEALDGRQIQPVIG